MIDFEQIEKPDILYELLYRYIRVWHDFFFYKEFYILHTERIPKDKSVLVISNHQNGLSDALGILFAFGKDGRRPVYIARADIFKKDLAAKLLRFLKIMPAYRIVDLGREHLLENKGIFDKAARILTSSERPQAVCVFPEAGHENCHRLGSFKSGFSRIAFEAAAMTAFKEPVYVLPCSNHYSQYVGFFHKMILTVGEPFSFKDLYDLHKERPRTARKLLEKRAREKVKSLMLDIEDRDFYDEYDILRILYAPVLVKRARQKVSYYPNLMREEKRVVALLDYLKEKSPEQFHSIMKDAAEYTRLLDKLRIEDWVLAEKFTAGAFLLRCVIVVFLLPFMLYGIVNNFIPYNTSTLMTRRIKDHMLHNSFHFVISFLMAFPFCHLAAFAVVWVFTKWQIALAYLASLPLSFALYLRGKYLAGRQLLRFYRFIYWWRGDWRFRRARELRDAIIAKLDGYGEELKTIIMSDER